MMTKRDDIEINKTTHGYKVTEDYGNVEIGFFDNLKESEEFVKEELNACEELEKWKKEI